MTSHVEAVQQVERALQTIVEPGGVFEIRAIHCWDTSEEYTSSRFGYFDADHIPDAAKAAIDLETRWHASAVYFVMNPINPDLIGRAANRVKKGEKGSATKDEEVTRRRWLLIDCDPKRSAGLSSSDAELAAAKTQAEEIRSWLSDNGFPEPIFALSANGFHLLYSIDLPAESKLVEQCLLALAARFSMVDTSVFNAARVTKLYGTLSRKGDHTDARPHRRSELLHVPAVIKTVAEPVLTWLADLAPKPEQKQHPTSQSSPGTVNLELYLKNRHVAVIKQDTWNGSRRYFIECPGIASHTTANSDEDCSTWQGPDGKICGKCFHSSCKMHRWEDIRDALGAVKPEDFPDYQPTQPRATNDRTRTQTPKNKLENRSYRPVAPLFVPFPVEIFPPSLAEFCRQQAKAICCDVALIALPVLAVMAGMIGNSRRGVVRSGWSEPSILWAVPVADSGSGKSPALDAARAPLNKLQATAVRKYEAELNDYKTLKRQFDSQKHSKTGSPLCEPEMPQLQDVFCDDVTVESLVPALLNRPRGTIIVCEELSGFFGRLNTYKSQGGGDEAFFLMAHGGRPTKINRKSGPNLFIPRTAISLTGTVQRQIVRQILSNSHLASGMAARFMFAMPPETTRTWQEEEIDPVVCQQYEKLVFDLSELPMEENGYEEMLPKFIGMTRGAQNRFIEFYNQIGASRPNIDRHEMKAAWAKLEGGAARIALVLACARFVLGDKSKEIIDEQDIIAGITAAKWFAREAERIYEMLGETDQDGEARELVDWVQSVGGSTTPNELRQAKRKYREAGSADAILQILVNIGAGTWTETATTDRGGKPARRFVLKTVDADANLDLCVKKQGLRPLAQDLDDSVTYSTVGSVDDGSLSPSEQAEAFAAFR